MTIIKFDTGRGYSKNGHRVVAEVVAVDRVEGLAAIAYNTVRFIDVDRSIQGQIDRVVTVNADVKPADVMRRYDAGDYSSECRGYSVELVKAAIATAVDDEEGEWLTNRLSRLSEK